MPFFAWRDFINLHTGILTFIKDLLFLNFIDHADTTYWFIFFIIVMYCKYNIHFDIWLPLPYWIRLTDSLRAFPLMIIGLYLCKLINFTKFLQGFVKISGALSLELYLGHVSARTFLTAHHMSLYILWQYLVMIGLSYLGSFILKWMENKIQGQLLPLSRKK